MQPTGLVLIFPNFLPSMLWWANSVDQQGNMDMYATGLGYIQFRPNVFNLHSVKGWLNKNLTKWNFVFAFSQLKNHQNLKILVPTPHNTLASNYVRWVEIFSSFDDFWAGKLRKQISFLVTLYILGVCGTVL